MSLIYFDGMNQYAAVAEPTISAPVSAVVGANPPTSTTVATDPSVLVVNTAVSNFQRHYGEDRTYVSLGTSLNANGTAFFAVPSGSSSADTRYTSLRVATNSHTINPLNAVSALQSITIGYKLKHATNQTAAGIVIGAFSSSDAFAPGESFGLVIDPPTGSVYIRQIHVSGVLTGIWAAGTFTDIAANGFIGTSNFIWGTATALNLQNLAANTVEITVAATGRVSVWINNLYVGSATFANAAFPAATRYIRIGTPPQISGVYQMAFFGGISDLYLLNGLGTRNTSRLGKVKVVTRAPKQDISVQFTRPDTINFNYEVAAQLPPKLSPSLVGVRAGDKDIYGSSAFNFTNEAIIATAITTTGYKTDPSGNDIAPVLRVGATDYVGNTNIVPISTTAMKTEQHIYEVNPATGQPFNKTDLDATQFGVTVVAPGT